MTPSRWPPSVVVGILVAACQPAPVVRGPTTAVVEAPAPEPAAETPAEAPEPTASQCGEWPHDPDDPRVGIYVIDGELDEHDTPRVRTVVIFDGTTVVSWDPRASAWVALRMECEPYSAPMELVEYLRIGPPYRYPAQVDSDGWLVVFNPCYGWTPIGRFVGERLVGCWRSRRRLPFAAVDELMEVVREPLYFERLFRCYETYQPHRGPLPPMPPPPRRWHRDDCAQQ